LIEYARSESQLRAGKGKHSNRSHLEGKVKRMLQTYGEHSEQYRKAVEEMGAVEGPEPPEALAYLWQMFQTLDGMRGVGPNGLLGFTPESIKAADSLLDWRLEPREVLALHQLDMVMRFPDIGKPEE
jgi:hypothetical protein